jgi:hypothetical protein
MRKATDSKCTSPQWPKLHPSIAQNVRNFDRRSQKAANPADQTESALFRHPQREPRGLAAQSAGQAAFDAPRDPLYVAVE